MKVAIFLLASLLILATIQASPVPDPENTVAELEAVGDSVAQVMCGPDRGKSMQGQARAEKAGGNGKGREMSKGKGKNGQKGKGKGEAEAQTEAAPSE